MKTKSALIDCRNNLSVDYYHKLFFVNDKMIVIFSVTIMNSMTFLISKNRFIS